MLPATVDVGGHDWLPARFRRLRSFPPYMPNSFATIAIDAGGNLMSIHPGPIPTKDSAKDSADEAPALQQPAVTVNEASPTTQRGVLRKDWSALMRRDA